MKTPKFILLLLFVLSINVLSFTQVFLQAEITQTINTEIPNPVESDCFLPDCQILLNQVKAAYQPLANEYCQDIFIDVVCCQQNMETHMLVRVSPNGIKCGKKAATQTDEDL